MAVDPSEEYSLRRSAAIHEAGHAVVAWALGLTVQELRIGDGGKGSSLIQRPDHLSIVERVAIAFAGMEATEITGGTSRFGVCRAR
jgi:membrane-associated protease RseP (regulator of RpoE activity)